MDKFDFEARLDSLIQLHDRKVCRQIDAAACGTPCDYAVAREAEERYDEAYASFLADVSAAMEKR